MKDVLGVAGLPRGALVFSRSRSQPASLAKGLMRAKEKG
jgi:hypothetical protein